jgi:hypothetical protein
MHVRCAYTKKLTSRSAITSRLDALETTLEAERAAETGDGT